MIMSTSSIKRQMKEASGSTNVASSSIDEVDRIVEITLNLMAKKTVVLLKRKKTATDLILNEVSPDNLKQGFSGVVAKAPIVRVFKDMMDRHGSERPYRMTKDAEDWLANFVNDFIYTISYLGQKEAEEDGKRTIQPAHVKLAHREILVSNM